MALASTRVDHHTGIATSVADQFLAVLAAPMLFVVRCFACVFAQKQRRQLFHGHLQIDFGESLKRIERRAVFAIEATEWLQVNEAFARNSTHFLRKTQRSVKVRKTRKRGRVYGKKHKRTVLDQTAVLAHDVGPTSRKGLEQESEKNLQDNCVRKTNFIRSKLGYTYRKSNGAYGSSTACKVADALCKWIARFLVVFEDITNDCFDVMT